MQVILREPELVRPAMARVYHSVLDAVQAGQTRVVSVTREKRTGPQNRMLHGLLQQVSKAVPWAGQHRDVTTWKRLMTAAWLRATGESPEVLPSIDGKGIEVIYEPTSSMDVAQLNSLIEFVQAWMSEQGIGLETVDMETGEVTWN